YRMGEEDVWYGWHVYHYLVLADNFDEAALNAKLEKFYQDNMSETFDLINGTSELFIQPLESIRLHSDYVWEMFPNGDIVNIYVFGIIALFLIVIACINYINISTARSMRRSKEVGMRKVLGSQQS
ncbi:MAG: ABC transporter permease, partial [Candidatus Cloacimonetes bacterium]|nr:ABC transporter permease [Candidatus Cloacimonadota bacterium]